MLQPAGYAQWLGEAEPLVIDDAFLDSLIDQMEEVRSTVTSEEPYANLADQEQQQRGLQA